MCRSYGWPLEGENLIPHISINNSMRMLWEEGGVISNDVCKQGLPVRGKQKILIWGCSHKVCKIWGFWAPSPFVAAQLTQPISTIVCFWANPLPSVQTSYVNNPLMLRMSSKYYPLMTLLLSYPHCGNGMEEEEEALFVAHPSVTQPINLVWAGTNDGTKKRAAVSWVWGQIWGLIHPFSTKLSILFLLGNSEQVLNSARVWRER